MSQLILTRHGATKREQLTAFGTGQLRNIAQQLVAQHVYPAVMLHSTYDRTRDSADALALEFQALGHAIPRIIASDEVSLNQRGIPSLLLRQLYAGPLLIVSHEPEIRHALEELTGASPDVPFAETILLNVTYEKRAGEPPSLSCKITSVLKAPVASQ